MTASVAEIESVVIKANNDLAVYPIYREYKLQVVYAAINANVNAESENLTVLELKTPIASNHWRFVYKKINVQISKYVRNGIL